MLVITRKPGESLEIGDDITVTVLGNRHRPVRLGIDAPAQVLVLRTELRDRDRQTHTTIGADGSSRRPPPTR